MFIFPDFLLLSTAHVTHTHILCLAVACRLLNTPFDRQVALVRKYSEGLGRGHLLFGDNKLLSTGP